MMERTKKGYKQNKNDKDGGNKTGHGRTKGRYGLGHTKKDRRITEASKERTTPRFITVIKYIKAISRNNAKRENEPSVNQ